MTYQITTTNGQRTINIVNGTSDTSTSLTLFGKNFAGYGPLENTNLLHLLENFADSSAPTNAIEGQTWWDTSAKLLKVRQGTGWKIVGGSTASSIAPTSAVAGDTWWDAINGQLNTYDGASWKVIGPAYSTTQGVSGPQTVTVVDTSGNSHTVVKTMVGGHTVSITSYDPSFNISTITGFNTIKPGVNLVGNINATYVGNAENALSLGGVVAANYLRSDVASQSNFPLTVTNNQGITVGANNDFTIKIEGSDVKLVSNVENRNISMYVTHQSVQKLGLAIDGTSGAVTVAADPQIALGVATKQYVDSAITNTSALFLRLNGSTPLTGSLILSQDSIYSIGTPTARLASIQSVSVTATDISGATGNFSSVTLNDAPTTPLSATSKQYVDTAINTLAAAQTSSLNTAVSSIRGSASVFTTLGAIETSLGGNANYANTVTSALALKAPLNSPTFTGIPTAPTPQTSDNSTRIATTSYVAGLVSSLTTGVSQSLTDYALLNGPTFSGGISISTGNASSIAISTATNGTLDIGSSANKFRTIYGTSMAANYADLAENYVADAQYEPGTVLDFGGEFEVTKSISIASHAVAGVVSTAPAYLMNAECDGKYVVAVALNGRCPVKVIGPVKKGDILVSDGNGRAKAIMFPQCGTVLGRALQDFNGNTGVIEIAVSRA